MVHPTHVEFDTILNHMLGERIAGRPKQDPYVQSQIQNYKIGSRLQTPDGLVWHYCRAGSVGVPSSLERGVVSSVAPQTIDPGVIGAHAVGSYQLIIADTAAVGVHPADYWANGKVEIWTAVPQHRMIKSSTPSNGVSVTLTLYHPLVALVANNTGIEICQSRYANVDGIGAANAQRKSCVGVALMIVTPLYYFWCQTWGMTTMGARHAAMGGGNDSRDVFFNGINHTIQAAEEAGYAAGMQRVGHLLPSTVSGHETIIVLQLDP